MVEFRQASFKYPEIRKEKRSKDSQTENTAEIILHEVTREISKLKNGRFLKQIKNSNHLISGLNLVAEVKQVSYFEHTQIDQKLHRYLFIQTSVNIEVLRGNNALENSSKQLAFLKLKNADLSLVQLDNASINFLRLESRVIIVGLSNAQSRARSVEGFEFDLQTDTWKKVLEYDLEKGTLESKYNGPTLHNLICKESEYEKVLESDKTTIAQCVVHASDTRTPQTAFGLNLYSKKSINDVQVERYEIFIPATPAYLFGGFFQAKFKLSSNFLVVDFVDFSEKYIRYPVLNFVRGYQVWDLQRTKLEFSISSKTISHHYMTIEDHFTTDIFLVENYLKRITNFNSDIPDLQIVSFNGFGNKEPLLLELNASETPKLEIYNLESFNQRKSEILFEVHFSGPFFPAPITNQYWQKQRSFRYNLSQNLQKSEAIKSLRLEQFSVSAIFPQKKDGNQNLETNSSKSSNNGHTEEIFVP